MNVNYQEIVEQLLSLPQHDMTLDKVKEIKRIFSKKHKLENIVSNIKILREYHHLLKNGTVESNKRFEALLKKRAVRSQSGIVSVQVLTKPFGCPGQCIFCPNDPTMPKSYIKSEPGAMRALLNQFDPYKQVWNRLLSLTLAGHPTDKIEMIVLGGTWDVYPENYKIEFIKNLYDACNTFEDFFARVRLADELPRPSKGNEGFIQKKRVDSPLDSSTGSEGQNGVKAEKQQKKFGYQVEREEEIMRANSRQQAIKHNETASHRIIGLTIETRPEFVTDKTCQQWRDLGVTRIEMGVQSMFNKVLAANKRGHGVAEIQAACHKMRQYGFKFSIHLMPGLYKSSRKKDIQTFAKVFSDIHIKPDELKFYPTSVIPNTELYNLYQQGKYKPLSTAQITHIIQKVLLKKIPPYTRIKRLIRDIPSTEIAAGSSVTNLSQLVRNKLSEELKTHPKKRKKLYRQLYTRKQTFAHIEAFLDAESRQKKLNTLQTFLIGIQPDIQSERNFVALDTRSREIRNRTGDWRDSNSQKGKSQKEIQGLVVRKYLSSVGTEYFVSIEDELGYLYGFVRLMLPKYGLLADIDGLEQDAAVVRELHVYGDLARLQGEEKDKIQHTGMGKQLMEMAEKISLAHGYHYLSVIAGIGVRKYYEKLGYELVGTYMKKDLGD